MDSIIFISNRLPVTVIKDEEGLRYKESIGGLSTGLKSYHEAGDSLWIGWPGIDSNSLTEDEKKEITKTLLTRYKCVPVFLSEEEIEKYYFGFSNSTIWPMFHYFLSKSHQDQETWIAYSEVNKKFFDALSPYMKADAVVWVHDYQLMLLPGLIRSEFTEAKIGFFLHIPFPSFEIFRLLIWRKEILEGLLGADVLGFHTHDYVRHFLNSSRRILGSEDHFNTIEYEGRRIYADAFPMGIDYEFFEKREGDLKVWQELASAEENLKLRFILSVDRLDYTKGIPERISAFKQFLISNPEYKEKVCMILIIAPSRRQIDTYEDLLKEIRELISELNGELGTLNWIPVWFFYKGFSQEALINFYRHADLLLVTPLRDGMNLVAKEYLAARRDAPGTIVLSETAGAASQLVEAVIVNPNDLNAISAGIKQALEMPEEEKAIRTKVMRNRIRSYDVHFWAGEFIDTLNRKVAENASKIPQINLDKNQNLVLEAYKKADNRCLFLDYDGTITGFKALPEHSGPDMELLSVLEKLVQDKKNKVVLVSGRDKEVMEKWFGHMEALRLVATHGLWHKSEKNGKWHKTMAASNRWKKSVLPIMKLYTDYMPGAFIEEKDGSLVLHYRQCDPDMVSMKINELRETINVMIKNSTLELQEGNKILEVKDQRVNKGIAVEKVLGKNKWDFILAAGDDITDEYMFFGMPDDAFTIKIGLSPTAAKYRLKSYRLMRNLLALMGEISNESG